MVAEYEADSLHMSKVLNGVPKVSGTHETTSLLSNNQKFLNAMEKEFDHGIYVSGIQGPQAAWGAVSVISTETFVHVKVLGISPKAGDSNWTKSPVCWSEVGESQLTGPELVRETTEKIVQIKNRLLTARSRKKSYADLNRRLTELRSGPVRTRGWNPDKLREFITLSKSSNLNRCFVNDDVVIPLEEVQLDNKLHFIEEPTEIVDREVKRLKQSQISIIKVRCNGSRLGVSIGVGWLLRLQGFLELGVSSRARLGLLV
ncbi:hypothetical protein Tco_0854785 [Tanacetum coccineum]